MKNLRQELAEGKVLTGGIVLSASPVCVEIMGHAGYDFVFIDTEHASASPLGDVEQLIRAAYAADIAPITRVVTDDVGQIRKCLDFGSKGIVAPMMSSKAQAERVVEACLFPPLGNRGACPGVRATKYGATEWFEFMDRSNAETIIMPIIERMAGVEHLEEILSVPGINALAFGPFDLAIELGIRPTRGGSGLELITHPEVSKHMEYVIQTCRRRHVAVQNLAQSVESALQMVKMGVQMVCLVVDTALLFEQSRLRLDGLRGGLPA